VFLEKRIFVSFACLRRFVVLRLADLDRSRRIAPSGSAGLQASGRSSAEAFALRRH